LIIVTKNEYVYESFSEDDESDAPKGKKSIVQASSGTDPAGAVGDKKRSKAGVAGQKNLMSFFGKK
jgi:DNA polymerase subunit Cdc27